MAICPNCGAQNSEDALFCTSCGASLNSTPAPQESTTPPTPVMQQYDAPQQAPEEPAKGFAIASMVCGIVAFFCFGIVLGVLAIVFGYVAKKHGNTGNMAKAGIILGIVALALSVVSLVVCTPIFYAGL